MGLDCERVLNKDLNKEKGHLMNANQAVTHTRISIYQDEFISCVRVYRNPGVDIIQSTQGIFTHSCSAVHLILSYYCLHCLFHCIIIKKL